VVIDLLPAAARSDILGDHCDQGDAPLQHDRRCSQNELYGRGGGRVSPQHLTTVGAHRAQVRQTRSARGTFRRERKLAKMRKRFPPFIVYRKEGKKLVHRC